MMLGELSLPLVSFSNSAQSPLSLPSWSLYLFEESSQCNCGDLYLVVVQCEDISRYGLRSSVMSPLHLKSNVLITYHRNQFYATWDIRLIFGFYSTGMTALLVYLLLSTYCTNWICIMTYRQNLLLPRLIVVIKLIEEPHHRSKLLDWLIDYFVDKIY